MLYTTGSQSWTAAGQRSSLAALGTAYGQFSYGYRADGLLASSISAGQPTSYAYGDNGLLMSGSNPWRVLNNIRDSFGRIANQANADTMGNPLLSGSLTWRDDSKIDTYAETRSGVTQPALQYQYNDRGQLLREPYVSGSGGIDAFTYHFDGDLTDSGTGAGVRTSGSAQVSQESDFAAPNTLMRVTQETRTPGNGNNTGELVAWGYDSLGAVVSGSSVVSGTETLVWDSFGRLVKVQRADLAWQAIFDGLGRRIRVIEQPIANGTAGSVKATDSFYDPQVEFLELGVSQKIGSSTTGWTWKVYGPDTSGCYGGAQGIGGFEATVDESGSAVGIVNDIYGNAAATVTGTTCNRIVAWNARCGAYGVLPGETAPILVGANTLAASTNWRGMRVDATGRYHMGSREYDPLSGRFNSADPLGHAASMDLYSYCSGDPVNNLDPTGRCLSGFNGGQSTPYAAPMGQGLGGGLLGLKGGSSNYPTSNASGPVTPFSDEFYNNVYTPWANNRQPPTYQISMDFLPTDAARATIRDLAASSVNDNGFWTTVKAAASVPILGFAAYLEGGFAFGGGGAIAESAGSDLRALTNEAHGLLGFRGKFLSTSVGQYADGSFGIASSEDLVPQVQVEWAQANGIRVVNGSGHAEMTLVKGATSETGALSSFEVTSPFGRQVVNGVPTNPFGAMCIECATGTADAGATTTSPFVLRLSRNRINGL